MMWFVRSVLVKRLIIAGVCLGAIGCLVVSLLGPSSSGPIYHGKSLRKWLDGSTVSTTQGMFGTGTLNEGASEAVRALGTNALPYILRTLQSSDSRTKILLTELSRRQSLIHFGFQSGERRRAEALLAVGALGETATPLIPQFTQMLDQPDKAEIACRALNRIGPQGFSGIVKALTNSNPIVRQMAMNEVRIRGPEARIALPELVRLLKDPCLPIRIFAPLVLGEFRMDAAIVVPELINAMTDQDEIVRANVVLSLSGFGREAAIAVPTLRAALDDPDPVVREHAEMALKSIEP